MPHWTVEAAKPVPVIVDKHTFTGSNGIASTTLITPAIAGDYRVNVAASPSDSGFELQWTWADDSGARSFVWTVGQGNGIDLGQTSYVIHAVSGTAITFSTSGSNGYNGSYHVYTTLEEL